MKNTLVILNVISSQSNVDGELELCARHFLCVAVKRMVCIHSSQSNVDGELKVCARHRLCVAVKRMMCMHSSQSNVDGELKVCARHCLCVAVKTVVSIRLINEIHTRLCLRIFILQDNLSKISVKELIYIKSYSKFTQLKCQ